MTDAMKPGTLVELPDGRRGRFVYHGLDGDGIKWGEDPVDVETILQGHGGLFGIDNYPEELQRELLKWAPDAMLRDPYPGAGVECVGTEYTIIEEPSHDR